MSIRSEHHYFDSNATLKEVMEQVGECSGLKFRFKGNTTEVIALYDTEENGE